VIAVPSLLQAGHMVSRSALLSSKDSRDYGGPILRYEAIFSTLQIPSTRVSWVPGTSIGL
jgi:hypothetical protein